MTSNQSFSAARALSQERRSSLCACGCSCSSESTFSQMNMQKSKSDGRRPKSEIPQGGTKAETRSACLHIHCSHGTLFGIRNSNFLRISAFGFRISAALLLLAAFLPACSKKPVPPAVLARVGNHEITIQDFEREVQWYEKGRRPLPDKQALLEQMISRELRLQKAKALG